MQFLMETAPQHEARLAEIERNSVLIQQAVLGLTEHQGVLQSALEQTQTLLRDTQVETDRRLRELGENTDRRIAQLVSAVAKLADNRPSA
jgi:hypothetical protein